MGLAASQARLLMLVGRKSDLELRLQQINQLRMYLANQVMGIANAQANDANVSTPTADTERRRNVNDAALLGLQQQDKILELTAQNINTQHEAVQTEVGAVQKVIQKNIAMSFKLMG